MTREQKRWVRAQPTFSYMIESNIIFTKCGKRFGCFDDYREWVLRQ